MNEGLKAAIQGWRDRRRRRRIDRLERKNTGRATLRDYKKSTGDEGGAPWGGG
jgi:RecB family exonuclease